MVDLPARGAFEPHLVERHQRFGKSPDAAREWVERSDEANARLVSAARDAADLVVRADA